MPEAATGQIVGADMIEAMERARIDQQVATAQMYRRDIKEVQAICETEATMDEDTAAQCFYTLPRAGKRIQGPSVRLSEIVMANWRNLRVRVTGGAVGDKTVTAVAEAWDLQTNVAFSSECTRRITDREGRRFNDDMIVMTMNAAKAIAKRDAVFGVVPKAFVKPIFEQCRLVSIGKALSMEQRRDRVFAWFGELGFEKAEVLFMVDRQHEDDLSVDDMMELTGYRTALKDGDLTVTEAKAQIRKKMGSPEKTKAEGALSANGVLGGKAKGKTRGQDNAPPPRSRGRGSKKKEKETAPPPPAPTEPEDPARDDAGHAAAMGESGGLFEGKK